jgi:chromosomal replication initiation ATPase DnaA
MITRDNRITMIQLEAGIDRATAERILEIAYMSDYTDRNSMILQAVIEVFNVSRKELENSNRKRDKVEARMALVLLLRVYTDMINIEIGRFIGRGHSMINYYLETVYSLRKIAAFEEKYTAAEKIVKKNLHKATN